MIQNEYEIALSNLDSRRLEIISSIREDMNRLGPNLKEQIDVLTSSINYCLDEASNDQNEVMHTIQTALKLLLTTRNRFVEVQNCFLR